MKIIENYSLKHLNTFGIDVYAKYFTEISSIDEMQEFLAAGKYKSSPKLILGGGSNILFTRNYDGIILKTGMTGIELIKEDDEYYYVKAQAGEDWHGLVMHCVENDYAGIENLSLIPGTVGAAPIQNIGAYGVELKDVFVELEAVNIRTASQRIFSEPDCNFGYRGSIFKNELKGEYIICSVAIRLRKEPVNNTGYGAIEQELVFTDTKDKEHLYPVYFTSDGSIFITGNDKGEVFFYHLVSQGRY